MTVVVGQLWPDDAASGRLANELPRAMAQLWAHPSLLVTNFVDGAFGNGQA